MLHIEKAPSGYSVKIEAKTALLDANIYRPETYRKEWRICYAACGGAAGELQGEILDLPSFAACKSALSELDLTLDDSSKSPKCKPRKDLLGKFTSTVPGGLK